MTATIWILLLYAVSVVGQTTLLLAMAGWGARWERERPARASFLLTIGITAAAFIPFSTALFLLMNQKGIFLSGLLTFSVWEFGVFDSSIRFLFYFGIVFLLAGAIRQIFLFVGGIFLSRQLMFSARPLANPDSQGRLEKCLALVHGKSFPVLFTSKEIRHPSIWCWGLHPAILFPENMEEVLTEKESQAVFLHELGHLLRKDHLTGLLARLSGLVLFWHPLYWRMFQWREMLADIACDLFVLHRADLSPKFYSEFLLRLASDEKNRSIYHFFAQKETVMTRITTVLDFQKEKSDQTEAVPRRSWLGLVSLGFVFAALFLSFFLTLHITESNADSPEAKQEAAEMTAQFLGIDSASKSLESAKSMKSSKSLGAAKSTNLTTSMNSMKADDEDGSDQREDLTARQARIKKEVEALSNCRRQDVAVIEINRKVSDYPSLDFDPFMSGARAGHERRSKFPDEFSALWYQVIASGHPKNLDKIQPFLWDPIPKSRYTAILDLREDWRKDLLEMTILKRIFYGPLRMMVIAKRKTGDKFCAQWFEFDTSQRYYRMKLSESEWFETEEEALATVGRLILAEEKNFDDKMSKIKANSEVVVRKINKRISEFPQDLTIARTPEEAMVIMRRYFCSGDPKMIEKMETIEMDHKKLPPVAIKQIAELPKPFCKALVNSMIYEVWIYRDTACLCAELDSDGKWDPWDYRVFRFDRKNKCWLWEGSSLDRYQTQRDVMTKIADRIAMEIDMAESKQ